MAEPSAHVDHLRILAPQGETLCQSARAGCAACCGVYNFADRSPAATRARLSHRTARVTQVGWDEQRLAAARDALLAEEAPHVLFAGIKVCPFAGLLDDDGRSSRAGCLIHPARHPAGRDLRHLAVYPREVCAGHVCAPHQWLRPVERALAQCAEGLDYGRVVTDAGLVKSVRAALEERLGRGLSLAHVARMRRAVARLWAALFDWPWAADEAQRFGAFEFVGDDAQRRTLRSCLDGFALQVGVAERRILDAAGSSFDDDSQAQKAVTHLCGLLDAAVASASESEHEPSHDNLGRNSCTTS